MRIDHVIYFSPGYRAIDIDFQNADLLIELFQSRIESYYFAPTSLLLNAGENNAFAAGVLIVAAIDAITYYSIGGSNRIKIFFAQLPEFKEYNQQERWKLGDSFDQNFRNGLVHEGRIKNAGQFSYAYRWLLFEEHGFMIINPARLQERLEEYFNNYLKRLKDGQSGLFVKHFTRQFKNEVANLQHHYR